MTRISVVQIFALLVFWQFNQVLLPRSFFFARRQQQQQAAQKNSSAAAAGAAKTGSI